MSQRIDVAAVLREMAAERAAALTGAEYVRPRFPIKTHPGKEPEVLAHFARTHPRCQACGTRHGLQIHHIVKQGRAHEPTNLLRLCLRCHNLAEGLDVRGRDGRLLPKLMIGHCLWLKREQDPRDYDPVRLQELRACRLPDPERPPRLAPSR